jgi:6-pyruvoyltetrahydropterin/6-carboxytetrahydropterin synthase
MRIFLERKFDAGHWLTNPECNETWNKEMFGKCCFQHGHTWKAQVEVAGVVNEITGMIVNFNTIKEVIDKFDHGVVNDIIELPTAENIVSYILDKLIEMQLFSYIRVRVYETESAYAEDIWETE